MLRYAQSRSSSEKGGTVGGGVIVDTEGTCIKMKGSGIPEPRRKRVAHEVIALSTNHIHSIDFSQC